MCRAIKVLPVATDGTPLSELMHAAVGVAWELMPGATSSEEALKKIIEDRPHVLVVWGPDEGLVRAAKERIPGLRTISSDPDSGADSIVNSLEEIREAILGLPRPGGPVGP